MKHNVSLLVRVLSGTSFLSEDQHPGPERAREPGIA